MDSEIYWAKEKVYFVVDSLYKSKFIKEIEIDNEIGLFRKCPRCKTADLVLRKSGTSRNGDDYKFYGCTNYLYGCTYSETEWCVN